MSSDECKTLSPELLFVEAMRRYTESLPDGQTVA